MIEPNHPAFAQKVKPTKPNNKFGVGQCSGHTWVDLVSMNFGMLRQKLTNTTGVTYIMARIVDEVVNTRFLEKKANDKSC